MQSAIQTAKTNNLVNKILSGDIQEETDYKPSLPVSRTFRITREKDGANGLFDPNDPSYKSFALADSSLSAHRKGNVMQTGLSEDDRKYFEYRLGLPKGTLLPTNFNFWGKQRITFKKKGKILNIDSNDEDLLNYKWLVVHKLVATSRAELKSDPSKVFLITSDEIDSKENNSKFDKITEAVLASSKMTLDAKINFLNIFKSGKFKVNRNATSEYINSIISKIVLQETEEFLLLTKDKDYEYRVLLLKLIEEDVIVKRNNSYFLKGEDDAFANSTAEVIAFLSNPKNNAVIVSLKAKIK
jgi:hypothetical protein